jgi:hypothetical protein
MPFSMRLAGMIAAASLLIVLGTGCASSPGVPAASTVQPASAPVQAAGGIYVKQVPMTPYMRSQVGTPNELSPLAPPQAINVRKVGDQWLCDINGQVYVYNGASQWVPR